MSDDPTTTALRRIYEDVAADLAGRPELFCELSGRCCRFRDAGHRLFLTRLEYEEMVRRGGAPGDDASVRCPWLEDGLCANREGRALACRTYFCSDESAAAEFTEAWHRQIRALHANSGVPYEYGPLERFVNPKEMNPKEMNPEEMNPEEMNPEEMNPEAANTSNEP